MTAPPKRRFFRDNFNHLLGIRGESGFGSWSTAQQVADKNEEYIRGRTFIITGASAGIGVETAKALASKGGHVIMACRPSDHAKKAYEEVQQAAGPGAKVELRDVDFSNYASVREFAGQVKKDSGKLDVLINNAGCALMPFAFTGDGYETTLQTNYLGPFLLTFLLLDKLKENKTSDARVVNVASEAHRVEKKGIDFMAFDPSRPFNVWKEWLSLFTANDGYFARNYGNGVGAYAQSKLMNILHALHLNKLMQEQEDTKHITAYSVHPGVVRTELARFSWKAKTLAYMGYPLLKNSKQGAATTVYCAVDPLAKKNAGGYFCDCNAYRPYPWAEDPKAAEKLYAQSIYMSSAGEKPKPENKVSQLLRVIN